MNKVKKIIIVAAILIVVLVAYFWQPITHPNMMVSSDHNDWQNYGSKLQDVQSKAASQGKVALWDSNSMIGQPMANAAVSYPWLIFGSIGSLFITIIVPVMFIIMGFITEGEDWVKVERRITIWLIVFLLFFLIFLGSLWNMMQSVS